MVAVDIPRKRIVEFTVYESLAEAEWFMHQFNHALTEFVWYSGMEQGINGWTLEHNSEPL